MDLNILRATMIAWRLYEHADMVIINAKHIPVSVSSPEQLIKTEIRVMA